MKQYQHHQVVLKSLKLMYAGYQEIATTFTDETIVAAQLNQLAGVQLFRLGYQHLTQGILHYLSLKHKTWRPSDAELKAMVRIAQAHDLTDLSSSQWEDLQDTYKLSSESYQQDEWQVIAEGLPKLFEAIDYYLIASA